MRVGEMNLAMGPLTVNLTVNLTGSGGFRNLEKGVQPLARKVQPKIWGLPRPLSVT